MFEVSMPDLVYCTKNLDTIEKALAAWGRSIPLVTSGTSNGTYTGFSDILKMDVSDFELETFDSESHILSIMFTSGTTGVPKGVMLPDANIKSFTVSGFLNYEPLLITSPPFWVSNVMGFSFVLSGLKKMIVAKRNFTCLDILETIQTYKPESWFTGHAIALDLTQSPHTPDYDLSSLKYFVTGGTLLLGAQRRIINKALFKDKIILKHLYGSTEAGIITNWADYIDTDTDEYNSVGCPAPGVSIKILGPNGELLGPNEAGEVVVKTQSLTPGLFVKGRAKNSALDDEGWFRTGDKGYYDEKHLLYIIGRIKDIMKFKGVQISPAELEEVVDKHPSVLESCAVGKPDVKDGDIPVIFVVLRQETDVSENELYQYIEDNIAEIKRPREIHIVDSLPKSAVGKVLRANLQKMFEN